MTSAAAILDIPDALKLCREFVDIDDGLVSTNQQITQDSKSALQSNLQNDYDDEHEDYYDTLDIGADEEEEEDDEEVPVSSRKRRRASNTNNQDEVSVTVTETRRRKRTKDKKLKKENDSFNLVIKQEIEDAQFVGAGENDDYEVPSGADDPADEDFEQTLHTPKRRKKKTTRVSKQTPKKPKSEKSPKVAKKKGDPTADQPKVPFPSFSCTHCSLKLFHYSSLQLHLRCHRVKPILLNRFHDTMRKYKRMTILSTRTENGDNIYRCVYCMESFSQRLDALKHVRRIHRKLFQQYHCDTCSTPHRCMEDLLIHRIMKHRQSKSQPTDGGGMKNCHICGRIFVHRSTLLKHLEVTHSVTSEEQSQRRGLYYCRHCQAMLLNKSVYISHLTRHKLTEKELQLEFYEPHKVKIRSDVKKQRLKSQIGNTSTASYARNQTTDGILGTTELAYVCDVCSRSYTTMHHLNAHMKLKHNTALVADMPRKKKSVACEEDNCGAICGDMDKLRGHMEVVHPLIIYECSMCRYKGVIKHMFHRHMKRVHEKQNDKICEFCGKSFLKTYHLRVHRMRHHGVKDPTLKIEEEHVTDVASVSEMCNITELGNVIKLENGTDIGHVTKLEHGTEVGKVTKFGIVTQMINVTDMGNVTKIMDMPNVTEVMPNITNMGNVTEVRNMLSATQTMPTKDVKCDMEGCTFETTCKRLLGRHHKRMHSSHQFACDLCDKTYGLRTELYRHIKCSHGSGNVCNICGKMFKALSSLSDHKIKVHDIAAAKYRCSEPGCNAGYNRLDDFVDHVNKHQNIKNYTCPECGKQLARRTGLISHRKRCNPNISYTCEICDKKFKGEVDLIHHQQKHSNDKLHMCVHCGKSWKWKNSLSAHRKKCPMLPMVIPETVTISSIKTEIP